MNVDARRPNEVGSGSTDVTENSSVNSSKRNSRQIDRDSDTTSLSSKSSTSNSHSIADNTQQKRSVLQNGASDSDSPSIEEEVDIRGSAVPNGDIRHSDPEPSISEQGDNDNSSIASESDSKGLLRSILSDSASEKIDTDVDVTSPKDGIFSSSTDDELLRKFREQQANKRFRPRSAKFRRDADPEPESVQRVPSRVSDKGSSKSVSYSSDSSDQEDKGSSRRRRQVKKSRKTSSSSASKHSLSDRSHHSSRSSSRSSNSRSSEGKVVQPPVTSSRIVIEEELTRPGERPAPTKTTTGSETSDSLTTTPTSPSESTQQARPPSRQEARTKSSRRKRAEPKSKTERGRPLRRQLHRRTEPVPVDSRDSWPQEPGFWWPYNEDTNERDLDRLIRYHQKRLNNLLAQEYLQRHLELELKKAGAQFKQYERGPRPLSPKQVRKFKERNVTWIYLDGKLHNIDRDMGSWNTTQRGRKRNKVIPNKDAAPSREKGSKSSERSKRSVSFEKGSGRKSSDRSEGKTPLKKLIKGLSPKSQKKTKRKGSGSGSRKSSLSSRGSSRTLSRSSSRTSQSRDSAPNERKAKGSRSRSRSSSRGSHSSRDKGKISERKSLERPKTAHRPKTAKPSRTRSVSSASKSSVDRSSSKEKRKEKSGSDKRSSSTGSEKKMKKSKEKTGNRSKHYALDEDARLNRVLFTEEYEKKWRMQKREKEQLRLPPAIKNEQTRQQIIITDQTYSQPKRENRPRSPPPQYRRPKDDYNFYKDPNIPGHAFPYYYLAYLMSMEGKKKKRAQENEGLTKIVLKPAPVNKPPIWRTHSASAKPGRSTLKQRQAEKSPTFSPKPRRKKKTKSVINERQDENLNRSSSRDSRSSSRNRTSSSGSHPTIRPGSGPIKCSWKAQTEPDTPKYPGSDHQLKNTDNPDILAWLRRKDSQLRARRQNEIRKQRRKTAKLIDEQNDLEDKHERALKQYELWKKNKDREILLRRRKEAKEANSAVFSAKLNEPKPPKSKDRPRTANKRQQKSQSGSTFSELRSSSASPNTDNKSKPLKQRPKSAINMGVSFSDQPDLPNQRPRSATPHRRTDSPNPQRTENFFKSFLGVGDGDFKGETSSATYEDGVKVVVAEDRRSYDKWVRSNGSNRSSPKVGGKKQGKGSSQGRTRKKQRGNEGKLPPHNHSDNDLISNLAKRRIETILASRKRVDTGLKKRPKSGENGLRKPSPPQGSRTDPTHRKWRLREDDIVSVESASQNIVEKKGSSSSSSSSGSDDERPKFSYSRKSRSTSPKHHRNPVIREALSGQ